MKLSLEKHFPKTNIFYNVIRHFSASYITIGKMLEDKELILVNDNLDEMVRFYNALTECYKISNIKPNNSKTNSHVSSLLNKFDKEVIKTSFRYRINSDDFLDIFFDKCKSTDVLHPFILKYDTMKNGKMFIDVLKETNEGIKKVKFRNYSLNSLFENEYSYFSYSEAYTNSLIYDSEDGSEIYLVRDRRYRDDKMVLEIKPMSRDLYGDLHTYFKKYIYKDDISKMDDFLFIDFFYHAIVFPHLKYSKILEKASGNVKYDRRIGLPYTTIEKIKFMSDSFNNFIIEIVSKFLFNIFVSEYKDLGKKLYYSENYFKLLNTYKHYNYFNMLEFIDENKVSEISRLFNDFKEGKINIGTIMGMDEKIEKIINECIKKEKKYIEEVIEPVFAE